MSFFWGRSRISTEGEWRGRSTSFCSIKDAPVWAIASFAFIFLLLGPLVNPGFGGPRAPVMLPRYADIGAMESRVSKQVDSLAVQWGEQNKGDCLDPELKRWKTEHLELELKVHGVSLVTRMHLMRAQEDRLTDLIESHLHLKSMDATMIQVRTQGVTRASALLSRLIDEESGGWAFLSSECGSGSPKEESALQGCVLRPPNPGIEVFAEFRRITTAACLPVPGVLSKIVEPLRAQLDANRNEYVRLANGNLSDVWSFSQNVTEGLELNLAMLEIELFKKRVMERQKEELDRYPVCFPYM